MKLLVILFLILLISCAHNMSGIIIGKEHNGKLRVVKKEYVDKDSTLDFVFNYDEEWFLNIMTYEGKKGKCEVTKTVYNIMDIGEYMNCSVLGKGAM